MLGRDPCGSAIITAGRRDVSSTFGLGAEQVCVIGEGYDRAVFHPREGREATVILKRHDLTQRFLLYAGTFSRHKNLKLILEAMVRLPPGASDVVLALVGRKDAGAFAEFQARVEALGLSQRVRVLGYVPRDELAVLMGAAAAFVYPSRYEGFGLAPLEAMACGAPVIASDVASLPEVVGRGGTLVSGEDPGVWAEAIGAVLSGDRKQARDRAVRQASKFDWDEASGKVLEVLQACG